MSDRFELCDRCQKPRLIDWESLCECERKRAEAVIEQCEIVLRETSKMPCDSMDMKNLQFRAGIALTAIKAWEER